MTSYTVCHLISAVSPVQLGTDATDIWTNTFQVAERYWRFAACRIQTGHSLTVRLLARPSGAKSDGVSINYLRYKTSDKEVMFYPALVCLFLLLLETSRKNYRSDLHENFTKDVSVDEKERTKFRKSSASRSRRYQK